jgi:hypothetical protein
MIARMLLISCGTAMLCGCFTPSESVPSGARTVQLSDFTQKSDVEGSHVIEVPGAVTAAPEVVLDVSGSVIGDTQVTEAVESIRTTAPDGRVTQTRSGPVDFNETIRRGVAWPVDGLVGQINGRPVFAAEFFLPIQDRLTQLALQEDLVTSRQAIIQIVRERFNVYVNSELIIAEAESELTPEMQQGIFAWLGMMEGEVTAERGGTRFAAEQSIMDETGLTMEEFLQQQKNLGLASQLLRKRVEPRAIVSWRDIEQDYRARYAEFNPAGSVSIGRVLLLKSRDADKIEAVRALLEQGVTFTEMAREIGAKDDGFWMLFDTTANTIESADGLRSTIREALDGLELDQATPAIEGRTSVSWYAVLGYDTPPGRSIFDPVVQLGIRNKLTSIRYDQQESRYLDSLRRRWVNDDIRKMEIRLVELALRRYWQG